MQDMEGYDEVVDMLLDGVRPEALLAGLPLEQRLTGLGRDQQALALPLDVVRALSDDYLRALSPAVQAELRRRLGAERTGPILPGSPEAGMRTPTMEGHDPESIRRLVALATPERVLADIPPEQRLSGLGRDQQALALPLDVVRALSDDYLGALPPEVQVELRRRLSATTREPAGRNDLAAREVERSAPAVEVWDELLEKLLALTPPAKVLRHYGPRQRLIGLDREDQARALPLEVLRAVSEDYLRSLSPEVQAELRRRLQRNGH
jgi:hypothetical protein